MISSSVGGGDDPAPALVLAGVQLAALGAALDGADADAELGCRLGGGQLNGGGGRGDAVGRLAELLGGGTAGEERLSDVQVLCDLADRDLPAELVHLVPRGAGGGLVPAAEFVPHLDPSLVGDIPILSRRLRISSTPPGERNSRPPVAGALREGRPRDVGSDAPRLAAALRVRLQLGTEPVPQLGSKRRTALATWRPMLLHQPPPAPCAASGRFHASRRAHLCRVRSVGLSAV